MPPAQTLSPPSVLSRNTLLLYSGAIAIRLALFSIPAISETLLQRVELATPVTSFKRCKLTLQAKLCIPIAFPPLSFRSDRRHLPLSKSSPTVRWRCIPSGKKNNKNLKDQMKRHFLSYTPSLLKGTSSPRHLFLPLPTPSTRSLFTLQSY